MKMTIEIKQRKKRCCKRIPLNFNSILFRESHLLITMNIINWLISSYSIYGNHILFCVSSSIIMFITYATDSKYIVLYSLDFCFLLFSTVVHIPHHLLFLLLSLHLCVLLKLFSYSMSSMLKTTTMSPSPLGGILKRRIPFISSLSILFFVIFIFLLSFVILSPKLMLI